MKKRIRTNKMRSHILIPFLMVGMGLGIWISCSTDNMISSIDQTSTDDGVSGQRSVGTKPAVGGSNYADFHPQTNVNYDPFDFSSEKGVSRDYKICSIHIDCLHLFCLRR